VIARCERRIGQELRIRDRPPPGPDPRDVSPNGTQPPTLEELGFEGSPGRKRAAAYQELAHPDVAKNVILDVIVEAGDRCGAAQRRSTPPSAAGGWIVR
jgi:hypothetical protein